MKKRKLVKRLTAEGAKIIREGGGHEIWESENGNRFTVPRHTKIGEKLAKIILKQAEK